MSLDTAPQQYRLGLIAAKDFDSPQVLEDLLGPKLAQISHIHTNGANQLIESFARENGLPCTVVPISGGRGLPASTRDIVEASDVVLIISTPASKSARQVAGICAAKAERDEAFKWRVHPYEPAANWKAKVGQICEILACMTREERAASPWANAAWKVVS